jgi:interferon gamma-inducible protein 30
LNLDWNAIYSCSTSAEGIEAIVKIAEKTESLSPAHTYVPWIVVNDQHTQSTESAVSSNMVRFVCSIYRGPVKIDACN